MNSIFITPAQYIDSDFIKMGVFIFIIVLVMLFVLLIIRKILEHKLKNKILDKGISESIVSSILQRKSDDHHINIKWFAILMSVGIGLFIVNYTLPLGIHSFAIMAICISVSFLLYFWYLKRLGK
ncbi:hypothetical protein [Aquimarina sp. Aq78]|uniref:hypothetical protein n=1 Tax=Aquimarina sp. Aq78 TaxID=1191889 RepID=UPI000D100992|nr:hypothetical protein [Aquimarina sp. Aq78]